MRFASTRWMAVLVALAPAVACGGGDAREPGGEDVGAGGTVGENRPQTLIGDGSPQSARFVVIADASRKLNVPRDLAFHPERRGEAWIINRADDTMTIVYDATGAAEHWENRYDAMANHFQEEASSIAFGAKNFENDYTFATCQESANTYDGQYEPNYFMGPALWSAHPDVYAMSDPYGLGSHLDMLHESPFCMGIAHEVDNVYWVFDGYHGRLARYDFQKDHDIGQDDHSDGIIRILPVPQVKRVPDVPSHLIVDKEARILYVADTGNSRVLRLEIDSGRMISDLSMFSSDRATLERWGDFVWSELVGADSGLLQRPSGIALHDGVLYVSDNATGEIHAFDTEGTHLVKLATDAAPGGLMGIEVGPDERLYFADALGNRIVRVER